MNSMLRSRPGAVGLLVAAVVFVGSLSCGPIKSTTRIGKASIALERARVNEAYRKAPYEYFIARYYFHKSKEEWGYSEFEASFDFADKAQENAESARRKAKEDPWKDPVEGRNKTYKLRPQETITVDPGEVRETEKSTGASSSSSTSSSSSGPEASGNSGGTGPSAAESSSGSGSEPEQGTSSSGESGTRDADSGDE